MDSPTDDVDDYPDTLMKTVLTFSPDYDVEKYDPSKELPRSGDDFLKYVMYETSCCEEIVTAKLDKSLIKNKVNYTNCEPNYTVYTPPHLIPSMEWQNGVISEFSELQQKMETMRTKFVGERIAQTRSEWSEFCDSNEPLLSTMLAITPTNLLVLLLSLTKKVLSVDNGQHLPRSTAVWLYSTLALLTKPLLPDTCFVLRQIARKCIHLRADLPVEYQESEYVDPLNLFICLISRCFNQNDLVDQCELKK